MKITVFKKGKPYDKPIFTDSLLSHTELVDSTIRLTFKNSTELFEAYKEAYSKRLVFLLETDQCSYRAKAFHYVDIENFTIYFIVDPQKNEDIFNLQIPQCRGLIFKASVSKYANTKGYYVHHERLELAKDSCGCLLCKRRLEDFYANVAEHNYPQYANLIHGALYKLTDSMGFVPYEKTKSQ